jgi:hypothetical protein
VDYDWDGIVYEINKNINHCQHLTYPFTLTKINPKQNVALKKKKTDQSKENKIGSADILCQDFPICWWSKLFVDRIYKYF